MLEKYLNIHPEIQKAISFGYPVVALDSSMMYNIMPYPQSIVIFNNICKIIRMNEAIPATIAIINGMLKVGLTEEELEILLMNNTLPVNVTDLPWAISNKLTCSTSLDSTITIASLSGLNTISTNNINGFIESFSNHVQISSDIKNICYNEIFVICNDINTNTDINITLNYLKANNIITLKYIKNEMNIDKIISLIKIKNDLNLKGGFLILNSNSSDSKKQSKNPKFIIDNIYSNSDLSSKIAKKLSLIYKK